MERLRVQKGVSMSEYQRALSYIGSTIVWKLYEHAPTHSLIHECFEKEFKILQELVDTYYPRMIKKFPVVNRNNEVIVMLKYCPKCKELLTNKNNYCCHCGQALDWSNDE